MFWFRCFGILLQFLFGIVTRAHDWHKLYCSIFLIFASFPDPLSGVWLVPSASILHVG